MIYYIKNMLENTPDDKKGVQETPDGHYIFDTYEDVTNVYQTDAELLYNILKQLMYL